MIRVLTIEREYASGGGEIAAMVAKHLGWTLYDQLLTNEIARLMECDCRVIEEREERRDPVFYRLLKAFMKGSHEGSQNAPRLKMVDAECIREATERVVKQAAERGQCVIVGRGSAYYLQDRRDAFHVFVYAPFNEKVEAAAGRRKAGKRSRTSRRNRRPRSRGLHRAIFCGRMAGSPPLSSDDQFHDGRGIGGGNNP